MENRNMITLLVLALIVGVVGVSLASFALTRPPAIDVNTRADATHSIAVVGYGQVNAAPDTAQLRLGLRVERSSARDAQVAAAKIMNDVVVAVKKFGLADADLKTTGLSIQPQYEYSKSRPTLVGYVAMDELTVETAKTGDVGSIMDAAIGAGANQVNGVAFILKNREKARQEALDKALQDARREADQVAGRTGTHIVAVRKVSIQESLPVERGPYPQVMNSGVSKDTLAPTPVLPGTTLFTVTAHVEYVIQ